MAGWSPSTCFDGILARKIARFPFADSAACYGIGGCCGEADASGVRGHHRFGTDSGSRNICGSRGRDSQHACSDRVGDSAFAIQWRGECVLRCHSRMPAFDNRGGGGRCRTVHQYRAGARRGRRNESSLCPREGVAPALAGHPSARTHTAFTRPVVQRSPRRAAAL